MKTRTGSRTSVQISTIGNIPTGNFELPNQEPFLIKNLTDNNIELTIVPFAGDGVEITTVVYPGWNVELVVKVVGATANTLQYGF